MANTHRALFILAVSVLPSMSLACETGAIVCQGAGAVVGARVGGEPGAVAGAVAGNEVHNTYHEVTSAPPSTGFQEFYKSVDDLQNDLDSMGIGGGSSFIDSKIQESLR